MDSEDEVLCVSAHQGKLIESVLRRKSSVIFGLAYVRFVRWDGRLMTKYLLDLNFVAEALWK